jgi:hypothetical protein
MCRYQTEKDTVINSRHKKSAALELFRSVLNVDVKPKHPSDNDIVVTSSRDSRWISLLWKSVLILAAAIFIGIRPMRFERGPFEQMDEEDTIPGSIYVPGKSAALLFLLKWLSQ